MMTVESKAARANAKTDQWILQPSTVSVPHSVPQVILKPQRAQPFFGRHPWVFAGAVERVEGNPEDGDEVELRTTSGTFVARGFFNSQSKILVRLYSWEPEQPLDESFF